MPSRTTDDERPAAEQELQPLAIDLFCGLGGWTDGLIEEGWFVVGIDIENHRYGEHCYPGRLVVQDVLSLHGSQFRDANLIVASPPCQFFSYTAMPWSRAKTLAAEVEADVTRLETELALFKTCFRIQREACAAAGRHIPLIVENVRGAQRWIGRARWNYGSYYLWGDVPALMPITFKGIKNPGLDWSAHRDPDYRTNGKGACFRDSAIKHHASNEVWFDTGPAALPSASPRRKAASAIIAKIPLALARHIAAVYRPRQTSEN